MLELSYDRESIQAAIGGKPAYIDTGNNSIQIPAAEFEALKLKLLEVDATVHSRVVDGDKILMSKRHCKDLFNVYKGIQLGLHLTHIEILPEGYLYSRDNYPGCFIGIQSIEANQYRLGTIFLQNFYLGLDYTTQQVAIGLNAGTTHASIEGYSSKIPEGRGGSGQALFLTFFMVGLCLLAGICYWRGYSYEQQRRLLEKFDEHTQSNLMMDCDEEDQEKSADKVGEELGLDEPVKESVQEKLKDI